MAGRDTAESQAIGSRIRETRIKNGMSQADLAVKANISLPHISDIERGKSNMILPSFIRITEALEVAGVSPALRPLLSQPSAGVRRFITTAKCAGGNKPL